MFEDIDADGLDLAVDTASDRELLHAVWARREVGDIDERAGGERIDAVEAWGELVNRYPEDTRFLLLLVREQWQSARLPPIDAFLRQCARIAADTRLREPLIDLLSLARGSYRDELRGEMGQAFEKIALAFDGARRDEEEASDRLRKVARKVLEECHDRTLGNRPLAPKRKPSEMRTTDWPAMLERSKAEPDVPYSTQTRFKVGAKVKHPTLGIGFVVERREGKIDVLFQSGKKTLIGK